MVLDALESSRTQLKHQTTRTNFRKKLIIKYLVSMQYSKQQSMREGEITHKHKLMRKLGVDISKEMLLTMNTRNYYHTTEKT